MSRQLTAWCASRWQAQRANSSGFCRDGHPQRVEQLVLALAQVKQLSREDQQALSEAALHHDVGRILLRAWPQAPYTERDHPRLSAELLRSYLSPRALSAVLHHRERWDGRGYPAGLRGAAIPELARVLAFANFADHYAHLGAQEQARQLKGAAGRQLDPDLVALWLPLGILNSAKS